jgi:hypothetical protein
LLVVTFFNGSEEDAKAYFKPLLDLGPIVDHTASVPYERVNTMLNGAAGFGGRKIFGGSNVALPLDPAFVKSVYEEFCGFLNAREGTSESLVLFEFQPYKKTMEVGVEETACANRGEYYNVGTLFKWYNPELDQEVRAFNRQINGRIRAEGGAQKSKGVGVYSNYLRKCSISLKLPSSLFFRIELCWELWRC